jgi:hypothetical protein
MLSPLAELQVFSQDHPTVSQNKNSKKKELMQQQIVKYHTMSNMTFGWLSNRTANSISNYQPAPQLLFKELT